MYVTGGAVLLGLGGLGARSILHKPVRPSPPQAPIQLRAHLEHGSAPEIHGAEHSGPLIRVSAHLERGSPATLQTFSEGDST
jgi:hypothetical protein